MRTSFSGANGSCTVTNANASDGDAIIERGSDIKKSSWMGCVWLFLVGGASSAFNSTLGLPPYLNNQIMNFSLVITIGVAVATAAALYYIFRDFQREKQRVNAIALHLRKLEGMVWAYNIRNQPNRATSGDDEEIEEIDGEHGGSEHGGSEHPEHDVEEHDVEENDVEEHDVEENDIEERHDPSEDEHSEEHHESGVEQHHELGVHVEGHHLDDVLMHQVISSMMGGGGIGSIESFIFAHHPPSGTDTVPVVEEINDEEPEVPTVISFDSSNSTIASPDSVSAEGTEDTSSTIECAGGVHATVCSTEAVDIDESVPRKEGEIRIYADTYQNRKLGRVGKSY